MKEHALARVFRKSSKSKSGTLRKLFGGHKHTRHSVKYHKLLKASVRNKNWKGLPNKPLSFYMN
jgi:hypothetical protein